MDSDSSEDRYRDQSNSAGGGSSTFAMFAVSSNGGSLPSQPGAYEDFNFPSPFDFDGLFPSSAPGDAASATILHPYSPSAFSPAYMRSQSPATAPSPVSFSSYTSSSNQPPIVPSSAQSQEAGLFDSSESALFSSFLNTIDVDTNFLFNPVLPPNMPSPPPAFRLREEDSSERERLGRQVGGVNLGRDAQPLGWSASTREVDIKPVLDTEPQALEPFEDEPSEDEDAAEDDTENDPDFDAGGRGSSTRSGRRTRGGTQQPTGGRGSKKARLQKEDPEESFGGDDDVEMAETGDDGATAMGPPASRRRTARAPAARRTSSASTSRPTAAKARAAAQQRSPSAEASASPPVDRKAPLTETQKRSNHIQSEQKRRNAIRNGFKDLVDILAAGESASGIIVAPPDAEDDTGRKKKGKGTGRGRGRKGEVGAGASKSVVLNKAAEFTLWMERGNDALEKEVARVEQALRDAGLDGFE